MCLALNMSLCPPILSLLDLSWGEGCLQHGGYEQEGEKEVLMRSCTDLCWKLSGRPPPAMPPPALPPSVGSSDPPQCAGESSGQHLNIWRQGERMRADGAQEVYSATPGFLRCPDHSPSQHTATRHDKGVMLTWEPPHTLICRS